MKFWLKGMTAFVLVLLLVAACANNGNQDVAENREQNANEEQNTNNEQEANGEQEADNEQEEAISYPEEDLMITVPYVAGGLNDTVARQVAVLADDFLDTSAAATNLTGGGGTLAATEYLQEEANTHNILLGSKSIYVTIPYEQNVQYTFDDMEPIIGIDTVEFILYASPDETGIDSMDSLMEYAQDNTVTFGTEGPGSDPDLIQKGLFSMMDVRAEAVVYDGAAESVNNVLSGEIAVAVGPPGVGKQHIEEGSLVAIGVATEEPYTGFEEEVPPFSEVGYDIDFPGFNFFAIRSGTDEAVIQLLHDSIADMYETEEFQELIENMELNLNPLTPEEINTLIEDQQDMADELHELIDS